MVTAYALLPLQLNTNELLAYVLHVADSCERHLLLDVVPKPIASDDVAEDVGNHVAEEHTAIDHGLEGEALTKGERHAPVGTDLVQTRLALKTQEIVCQVGILCFEADTAGGENPIVLAIIVCSGTIAEIVLVIECQFRAFLFRHQYVAVSYIIPAESNLEVEVPDIKIERQQFCLMLMVQDAVVVIPIDIDIYVIPAEGI